MQPNHSYTLTGWVQGTYAFIVIDNLFLDVVMRQPDKAYGFAHSSFHSARDYVNAGNLPAYAIALPVFTGVGALMGAIGGRLSTAASPR